MTNASPANPMLAAMRDDLPAAPGPWTPGPEFAFVGGNNDADSVPFAGLAEAAVNAITKRGRELATYNLGGSPLGVESLRDFIAGAMAQNASTPTHPDEVLIVSGSLQALDLVNKALVHPGDVVLVEQATYGGALPRIASAGATWQGVELDDDGVVPSALAATLDRLEADGQSVRYLYLIPSVQNPTGSVMPIERRREILDICKQHDLVIFEDDCYADLIWDGDRPPTFRALDDDGRVVYCASFSKSIAPALRVGYIVADEAVIRQLVALKTDAGTGAIEQLTLAEFAPAHFDDHVLRLRSALKAKCDAMIAAVEREFGDGIHVTHPKGGIYVWLTFPEGVDTGALAPAAAEAGVEFNPGAGWSADAEWGSRRLRLCFGDQTPASIDTGVAALARVYREAHPG